MRLAFNPLTGIFLSKNARNLLVISTIRCTEIYAFNNHSFLDLSYTYYRPLKIRQHPIQVDQKQLPGSVLLKNCTKFTGKYISWRFFFNKVAGWLWA